MLPIKEHENVDCNNEKNNISKNDEKLVIHHHISNIAMMMDNIISLNNNNNNNNNNSSYLNLIKEEKKNNLDYFCPIYVLSKARYHSERGTISLLIQDQIPFTIVVESEELKLYEEAVDRLVAKWWGNNNNNNNSSDIKRKSNVLLPSSSSSLEIQSKINKEEELLLLEENNNNNNEVPFTPLLPLLKPSLKSASDVRQLIQIKSLPLSNQGVSYVRNYILTNLVPDILNNNINNNNNSNYDFTKYSSSSCYNTLSNNKNKEQWFWVMDDDIQRFHIAKNGKNYIISPRQLFIEVYTRIRTFHNNNNNNIMDMQDIAIFSLEYARFAYSYTNKDLALNSYNNIASLFRYDLIPSGCKYRFNIREDYDFTLQLISHGLKTARFRNISFDVPGMAELAGGMTEYYKTQKEDIRKQNKLFINMWPAVAQECIKGKGIYEREDIRVRWDLLHPRKNKNPQLTLQSRIPLPVKIVKGLTYNCMKSNDVVVGECKKENLNNNSNNHTSSSTRKKKLKSNILEEKQKKQKHKTKTKAKTKDLQVIPRAISTTTTKTKHKKIEEENKTDNNNNNNNNKPPPGWKGYAMETWRYLSVAEAKLLHLNIIPQDKLRLGQVVAIVPPLFSQKPSVVEAVLVDKSIVRRRRRREQIENEIIYNNNNNNNNEEVEIIIEWSAVARGLPLLTVTQCYEIPTVGIGAAAAAVDAFFESEEVCGQEKR